MRSLWNVQSVSGIKTKQHTIIIPTGFFSCYIYNRDMIKVFITLAHYILRDTTGTFMCLII